MVPVSRSRHTLACRTESEQERAGVGALSLILADRQQGAQEPRPQTRLPHDALERSGATLEARRIKLEGAKAATQQLVIFEGKQQRVLLIRVDDKKGGLQRLVVDLRLVEGRRRHRGHRRG